MKTIIVISTIIFLAISILLAIIVNWRIKERKTKLVETYAYGPIIKRTVTHFCVVIIVSLFIYAFSKSLEVTITLGALLLIATIGGGFFGLLLEHQAKRRGARLADDPDETKKRDIL